MFSFWRLGSPRTQPPIHEVHSLDTLNTSQKRLFDALVHGANMDGSSVDVRDVAQAHVLTAQVAAAGNERFVTNEGDYWTQEICKSSPSLCIQLPDSPIRSRRS